MIYYLAAIGAAFLWALSSMVSKYAVDLTGAIAFKPHQIIDGLVHVNCSELVFS